MRLTIEIKDSVADKILYFLEHFKNDITIIHDERENLDIEIVTEEDSDYPLILKGREERKTNPENYMAENEINWD
jgi:hypothetical protein